LNGDNDNLETRLLLRNALCHRFKLAEAFYCTGRYRGGESNGTWQ